ncbi:hypothetical protein A2617_01130 [Candidatus Daviesbacteria bacterium RIFOXYD1_FULL_41_10]|uniref:Peptidase A2 domain-containing protein n=2 Tax=Microgenomates group TaxID=1794810 RepID=A0A1F5N0C3_9BACT|nr:MAG: hypothetical protein US39_C0001G0021 [Microgenomates group bacterium GW2011_GWC1_37_12b]OGE71032.1 MAG: hypothetical protein A2617_01130 [Candidatus Daviesbacteria bacterium RIFOXYD1_FULL_41_10]
MDNTELEKLNDNNRFIKVMVLVFSISLFTILYIFVGVKFITARKKQSLLLKVPLRSLQYQTIGETYEPILEIQLKLPDGFHKYDFLLDSGATISSLPYEMAGKLNFDIMTLPRIAFTGYGNSTSFAYQGSMTIQVGNSESLIPVVFTESSGSKYLIGRKGFFENYSITFNHKDNTIEIKK